MVVLEQRQFPNIFRSKYVLLDVYLVTETLKSVSESLVDNLITSKERAVVLARYILLE